MRCFLAIPIAEPALGAVRLRQAELRERLPATRWARPESLHLTVHFFGDVAEAAALRAVELVTPHARRTRRFDVDLERLGAFPSRGAPRVLWLGPAHAIAPLTALAGTCRAVLHEAGFDVETREYNAHCTLGRPRAPWSEEAAAAWAATVTEHQTPMPFTASRLVLYDSRPAPGGAIYTERRVLPFEEP